MLTYEEKLKLNIELNNLRKSIPKEFKNDVNKLIDICLTLGADSVLSIVQQLADIPIENINDYGVYPSDQLDGG